MDDSDVLIFLPPSSFLLLPSSFSLLPRLLLIHFFPSGCVRLAEAEQAQLGVDDKTSVPSYHSRIATDTMLRVTRPCLLEHCLSATIINRMMKGIMVGTFGKKF